MSCIIFWQGIDARLARVRESTSLEQYLHLGQLKPHQCNDSTLPQTAFAETLLEVTDFSVVKPVPICTIKSWSLDDSAVSDFDRQICPNDGIALREFAQLHHEEIHLSDEIKRMKSDIAKVEQAVAAVSTAIASFALSLRYAM